MTDATVPEPGRIFSIPLLGGGFAYGYVTAELSGLALCDIFDYVGSSMTPPPSIAARPLVLRDLIASGEFALPRTSKAGQCWKASDLTVGRVVRPENRYVQMGLPPRRVDLLREEPDAPVPPGEASRYRKLSKGMAPQQVAAVEVAVKRLRCTAAELIAEWRAGKLATQPGVAAAPSKKPGRTSTSGETLHVQIRLAHPGFPTTAELAQRHALEDLVAKTKLGEVVDAGAGGGAMDVYVRASATHALEMLRALLEQVGISSRDATVERLTS